MTSATPHGQTSVEFSSQDAPKASEPDMPVQRHAGQVGYGPNYHAGPMLEDRVIGLKEELIGKVTRNPERVRHGHEVLTGEERRKKLTGTDEPNPFHVDEDNKSDPDGPSQQTPGSQSRVSDTASTPPGILTKPAVGTGSDVAPQSTPDTNM